ncbi:hypothetical protein ILYODFUR_004084 [Ilyodon furcidens]|uniref:Uncharacterized protein n=1 Tax=Ilyodon furcidens TaxID=33524 RepID=A0ABV0V047_9TELE
MPFLNIVSLLETKVCLLSGYKCQKWSASTRTRHLPLHPGPGRGGSRLSRCTQTSLSPDTSFSSSGVSPRHSQSSRETVPPACSGPSPGPPPDGACLGHFLRKASGRHPV